jgi:hypothetical protein
MSLPTLALLVPLVLQGVPTSEPNRADLVTLATFAQDRGDFARARELYERALLAGPLQARLLYRAAECSGSQGDSAGAVAYLMAAASAGWRNPEALRTSTAFGALHAHSAWPGILARVERAEAEHLAAIRLPALRAELLARMAADQAARERIDALPLSPGCSEGASAHAIHGEPVGAEDGEYEVVTLPAGAAPETCVGLELERVDRDNTTWLREVVARHGWPTRSLVGDDGEEAVWLLVQHADLDRDFQRRCLELLRAAAPGEVAPDHVAYLTDRLAVAAGEPQLYGTQFRAENGRLVPAPILEPERVDERRRAVGLCSLAVYAEHFALEHAPE